METTSWVMGEPFGTCIHTKPITAVLTSLFPASVRRGNKRAGTGLLREPVSAGLFFNWTGEKQTGMGKRNCVQNQDSHTETVKQRPQGPKLMILRDQRWLLLDLSNGKRQKRTSNNNLINISSNLNSTDVDALVSCLSDFSPGNHIYVI